MSAASDIATLVSARTGIELTRGGLERSLAELVERRRRKLALSQKAYRGLLHAPDGAELQRLVDEVTVGYTWFFRDPGQLAAVERMLLEATEAGRKTSIWVPGCATGEDAYSLALIAERIGRDVEILGTDLNSRCIEQARRASFGAWSVRDLDARSVEHFTRSRDGTFVLSPTIARRVRFLHHNLLHDPPCSERSSRWDVILCRNVLIYFSRDVATRVYKRLAGALTPGGHLLLGASEVVFDVPRGLGAVYVAGRLVFRRGGPSEHAPRVSERRPVNDWLLEPAGPARPTLVSAFPRPARGIAPPEQRVRPSAELEAALAAGHALLDRGDTTGACDAYRAAAETDRTHAEAQMYFGVACYLSGEVQAAIHALRAALFLDGDLWPAAFYLALCHENSGDPEQALSLYRHVVSLDERMHSQRRRLHSLFDAWRADVSELARRRVVSAEHRAPDPAELRRRAPRERA